MATVGLGDVYYSKITEGESGDTYATPVKLAKGINVKLSVETATGELWAGDSVDDVESEFVAGELTINVNDVESETEAELLGQTKDSDGVVYSSDEDDPPYVAVGFRSRKPKKTGKYVYVWLYKVKFEVPSEEYKTKAGSIEFTTPEIVGRFVKRLDGKWRAKAVLAPTSAAALSWFTKVREEESGQ